MDPARHVAASTSEANPIENARDGTGREITVVGRPSLEGRAATAETLLRAWPAEGGPLAPVGLEGPFAAVVRTAESVTLVRGPLGRVPLYYHRSDAGSVLWSTHLRPVSRQLRRRLLDLEALPEIFHTRWAVGERTLVAGVSQVLAGSALRFDRNGSPDPARAVVADVRFRAPDGGRLERLPSARLEELTHRTGEALQRAVRSAIEHSDRPAVLLSGGVDSSLLAALAIQVRDDVVALTPTWTDHGDPEIDRARRYAEHLGITHEVISLADADITRAAPEFVRHLALPPRDYWAVALHAALGKVRGRFDVVLHGEGADTLFGNSRITRIRNLAQKQAWVGWVPGRRHLAGALRARRGVLKRLCDALDPERAVQNVFALPVPSVLRQAAPQLFQGRLPAEVLARTWDPVEEPYARSQRFAIHTSGQAHLRELTAMEDALGFRFECPFLDPGPLSVAATLPTGAKLDGETTKPLLRRLSSRYFPEPWAHDTKLGFPTPRSGWLLGPLAPWVSRGLGKTSVGARVVGTAVARLDPVADYEAVWTLTTLDEAVRDLGIEPTSIVD